MTLPGEVVVSAQAGQLEEPGFGCAAPAGQVVQVALPDVAANDPAGHGAQ